MDIIRRFIDHKVAANMLMLIMIVFGFWGIRQINVQLNPEQSYNNVIVEATWPGASAEDVERQIIEPLEHQLYAIKDLRAMKSTIEQSQARIDLEFDDHMTSDEALNAVKQASSQVRVLPSDMEPLRINPFVPYERLVDVLVSGDSLAALVPLALRYERELLNIGIDRVEFLSIPDMEMAIEVVDRQTLLEMDMSLDELSDIIAATSRDYPGGTIGSGENSMKLRNLNQKRTVEGFNELLLPSKNGGLLRLGDIADISEKPADHHSLARYNDKPAIWMRILRAPQTDTLAVTKAFQSWYQDTQMSLPKGTEIHTFLETRKFTEQQLDLVIKNGVAGLFLVLLLLFVFLNARVAFWVTLGIPISFGCAVALFYYAGGSINALSLIGLVMALGIVVDDAIVVAEKYQSQSSTGLSPNHAAHQAAQRMFLPVTASSLTTIAALIPIMLVDGGALREIPLLICCVIIFSMLECFLVLPSHLRGTGLPQKKKRFTRIRSFIHANGQRFRDTIFLPLVHWVLRFRFATLCMAIMIFFIALSLLISGRIKTEISVGFSQDTIKASVRIPSAEGEQAELNKHVTMQTLEDALQAANQALGGELLHTYFFIEGEAFVEGEKKYGKEYVTLFVEMTSSDQRTVRAEEFFNTWHQQLSSYSADELGRFELQMGQGIEPDLSLYFTGEDTQTLKQAAEEFKKTLATYPGVYSVSDDLPYGKYQWIFQLTPEGRAMGLTADSLARQVYAAYEGSVVQLFNRQGQEFKVVVKLPLAERENVFNVMEFPVRTENGHTVPLASIAEVKKQKGIHVIQHFNAELAVNITARVDPDVNTSMSILQALENTVIPDITAKYNIGYGLSENSAAEQRIIADLLWGVVLALVLIYLLLCWSFSSYLWPLAVMLTIPLTLTGALFGLYLFGMNLGVLSILGLFTLSGVIVNDAIILINDFIVCRTKGVSCNQAIEQAATSRLRAVLLTSATTTVGLLPMMFERSLMGSFMAPLAVVICFGMIGGTLLILLVIPAMLSLLDSFSATINNRSVDAVRPQETVVSKQKVPVSLCAPIASQSKS